MSLGKPKAKSSGRHLNSLLFKYVCAGCLAFGLKKFTLFSGLGCVAGEGPQKGAYHWCYDCGYK